MSLTNPPTLLTADPDTSNVSSYATPSVSPSANAGILAFVFNTDGTNAIEPTFSSAFNVVGGSWTNEGSIQASAATRRWTLFTATTTGSPGSGAGTADFGGDAQTGCTIYLIELTGQDTTDAFINFGSNEGGGAGATSLTLTLPSALSSANNMMIAGIMHNTVEDQTATGGGTELGSSDISYSTPSSRSGIYYALNDNSIGASWATSSAKLAIGIEVVEATSGATLSPASIVHTRGDGTHTVSPQVVMGSIVHTRAMGGPVISPQIVMGSIVHSRAMGTILVSTGTALSPASIVHTRAMGSPVVNPQAIFGSIIHTRAMGSHRVSPQIIMGSIVHTRAMGLPTTDDGIPDVGGAFRDTEIHHHIRSRK